MRRLICAAPFIFIACALDASAVASGSYGDIDITINNPVGDETSHGYASYGVQVQNRSPNKTRRVKIRIEPDASRRTFYEDGSIKTLSRTIEVAPNATVHTSIRQPFLTLNSWHLKASVWIDGQKQTEPLRLPGFARIVSYLYNPKTPDFRINDRDPVVAMDGVQKMRLPQNAGAGSVGAMRRRDLETNGLIYGSLDGILLTLDEAEALSGAEREALWEYVKSGGSLSVMGDGKLPDEWQSLDARLENSIQKSGLMARYEIGFGQLILTQPPPHEGAFRYSIYDSWKKTQQPWNATYTPSGANAVLPVAEPYNPLASYRRMFFLMLFLAVLIGPVNIYLFRKIDRRMNLYWTVPAASLLACVLVVFYAAIGDEGKRMRVCSLTYLDQAARSASTIGWVGFYSPSAHPDGLLFEEETELTIQSGSGGIQVSGIGFPPSSAISFSLSSGPPPTSGATSTTGSFTVIVQPVRTDDHPVGSIDWTDGQRWSGEWINPRIPLHFQFRKIQERNERIEIKRNGGALKVVNRLGAGVKAFWYADHDGKLYQASNIQNGAEAVLTEAKGVEIGGKTLRRLYISQDWVSEIEAVKASPAAYLQPGRYIAELEENVFLEKAMKGAKMKPSTFLVVGDTPP